MKLNSHQPKWDSSFLSLSFFPSKLELENTSFVMLL